MSYDDGEELIEYETEADPEQDLTKPVEVKICDPVVTVGTVAQHGVFRTFVLTSDNPYKQLLAIDALRVSATIVALDADVVLTSSRAQAMSPANLAAGLATPDGSVLAGLVGGGSVTSTGVVTGPSVGATITSIAATSLPAGWYDITTVAHYGGTTAAGTERNNMQLQTPTTAIYVINIPGQSASNSYNIPTSPPIRTYLDGRTALSITAIGAGTGTAVYSASIIATPAGRPIPTLELDTIGEVWATAPTGAYPARVAVHTTRRTT